MVRVLRTGALAFAPLVAFIVAHGSLTGEWELPEFHMVIVGGQLAGGGRPLSC